MATKADFEKHVAEIIRLSGRLPSSVPLGMTKDKLYKTFTAVSGASPFETFNRRFDIVFGEGCRDAEGRLFHLRQGGNGLGIVCSYLRGLAKGVQELPFDIMNIKVARLADELTILTSKSDVQADPAPVVPTAGQPLKLKIPARPSIQHGATLTSNASVPSEGRQPVIGPLDDDQHAGIQALARAAPPQASTVLPAAPAVVPSASSVTPPAAVTKSTRSVGAGSKRQLPLDAVLKGPPLATFAGDDEKDKDYKQPRRLRSRSTSKTPDRIFNSDGEEILEDVQRMSRKRPAEVISGMSSSASDDDAFKDTEPAPTEKARKGKSSKTATSKRAPRSSSGKYKRPTPRPKKKAKQASSSGNEQAVSSGEESDGKTALRQVEAQDAAASRKRGPTNTSLQHWHAPVPVRDRNLGNRWQFKCRYCAAVRTFKRTLLGATADFDKEPRKPSLANLASHLKEDHPDLAKGIPVTEDGKSSVDHGYTLASAKLMEGYLKEGQLNPALEPTKKGFYRLFAAWILDDNMPFTSGESPSLARLFKYLKINFILPSDTTVRNVLAQIFAELHGKVVHEFSAVRSKIAYSTDTWSTRQMVFTFAGTLAHFIDDDWKLVERLVDFYHIQDDEHKGQQAAKALTMDNASANDVLARTLSRLLLRRYGLHFSPENGRIRCIAHVVNLVVQSIVHELFEADDPALADYYELWNKHLPFHYDAATDDENTQFDWEASSKDDGTDIIDIDGAEADAGSATEDDEDDEEDEDDDPLDGNVSPGQSALKKLRHIVNKIVSSPQRRSSFRKVAHTVYTSSSAEDTRRRKLMVIRDVATRWNYTHAMIERGLLMQEAIDTWVFKNKQLRSFLLSAAEWQTLRQLGGILEVFTNVTKEMSHGGRPTLPFVLPLYERMRKALQQHIDNSTGLSPSLRNAAAAGLIKLNQYYEYAKESHYTIIATVLHPSLRTSWFKNALGADVCTRAEVLFKHAYEEYSTSATSSTADETRTPAATATRSAEDNGFLDDAVKVGVAGNPNEQDAHAAEEKPELERYLAGDGGHGELRDPLSWWKKHAVSFPVIARMARDFLAIPATSVAVERLFSKSRHLCTDVRASLRALTITEAMCVKYWIRSGLLSIQPPTTPAPAPRPPA
ncbi:hypothetical protein VTO73DRAFT_9555 [Trametes versicolor]